MLLLRRLRILALFGFFALPAQADRLQEGDWIASGGMGFISAPGLFLISPHLEKVHRRNFFVGALIQAGMGGSGALFTLTGTARLQVGNHPRLRPTIEGGLGVAASTVAAASKFGIALHVGMGVDWLFEPNIAFSTIVRACFAPPAQTFFLSWPIFQVRYLF